METRSTRRREISGNMGDSGVNLSTNVNVVPRAETDTAQQDISVNPDASNGEVMFGGGQVWRMSSREAKDAIPIYQPGDGCKIAPTRWLTIIKHLATENNWSEPQKIHNAQVQLRGGARSWYDANMLSIGSSWANFEKSFTRAFPDRLDFQSVQLKMLKRQRSSNESLEDYVFDMQEMGVSIGYPKIEIMRMIRSGIPDFKVRNQINLHSCQEIEDLLDQLRDAEAAVTQENIRKRLLDDKMFHGSSTKFKRDNRGHKKKGESPTRGVHHSDKTTNLQRSPKSGKFETENSKARKPFPKERKDIICYACRERGHISRNCPSKKRPDFRLRVLQRGSTQNNEYFKLALVNGQSVRAFVDLGATCSTISEGIANSLSVPIEEVDVKIRGVGKCSLNVTKCVRGVVKVDDIEKEARLHVVPDDFYDDCDVILGNDFINAENVEAVKTFNKFVLRKILSPQINRLDSIDSQIQVSPDCSEADKWTVIQLVQEYRDCFALTILEIGCTHLIQMKITLTSTKPVQHKPRKLTFSQREFTRKMIFEYQAAKLVQGSYSTYASAIVLTQKQSGEWRMCTDYRDLNEITEKDMFPCPEVDECLSRVSGNQVFSNVDMTSGYLQVPMHQDSIHLTGFVTPDGHYEYLRMPFGLKNAPQIFHRLMQIVMEGLDRRHFIVFMDDVLIASKTPEDHMEHLKMFFQRLRQAGLTLNPSKCQFLQTTVDFLGHKIDGTGIQLGDRNTLAVKEFPVPTDLTEVQKFLGLTSYFRKFIPHYSQIARPLSDLQKGPAKFQWGPPQQEAFEKLKGHLISSPVLSLFDPTLKHEVHTDASSHGLAAVLMQIGKDNKIHPVAYYSKKTTDQEAKYPSYELETLAVVSALERFKPYLMDQKFTVVTDCQALAATKRKQNLVPKIARWWMAIQAYDFVMQHRKAEHMQHADALSRAPVEIAQEMMPVGEKLLKLDTEKLDWISAMQYQDPRLKEIADVLSGKISGHESSKKYAQEYQLLDGRLYRTLPEGPRFVVPRFLESQVIREAHTSLGHAQLDRVVGHLRKYYYFSRLRDLVRKHIDVCINCRYHQRSQDESRHELHSVERVPVPFHAVHLDHCGPYVTSKGGNKYILALVDSFTKFCVLKPVKDVKSNGVKKLLLEVSQYVGMPARVVTDHGSAFTSKDFMKFCEDYDITHSLTAVAVPRGNGQVERYFRTLKPALAAMLEDPEGRDWDQQIRAVQWSMNSLKNRMTGKSPQELLFAYTPRNILGNHLQNCVALDLEENPVEADLPELRKEVNDRMSKASRKVVEKYNQSHPKPRKYKKGDLVLVLTSHPATGTSKKLLDRYRGPYVVSNDDGAERDRYEISDADGLQLSQKPYKDEHAADRMKPWPRLENFEEIDLLPEEDSSPMISE